MSNALTLLTHAALAASLCALLAAAQTATAEQHKAAAEAAAAEQTATPAPTPVPAPPGWVAVSPEGEEFAVLMPKEPLWLEQTVRVGRVTVSGRRYTATADGRARYVVWSLLDPDDAGRRMMAESYAGQPSYGEVLDDSIRLDFVAEVAWELLVRPELERLALERLRTGTPNKFAPDMSLGRGSKLGGRYADEYTVRLENEGGSVYVCADGPRLYVVAALAADPVAAESRRFLESFAVGTKTPNLSAPSATQGDPTPAGPATGAGAGVGTGPGVGGGGAQPPGNKGGGDAPVDYGRPFRQAEVTKKAVITFKPEPGFTEGARKFNVTGVVRMRAVLAATGEVKNISIVKGLPHGLTLKAIAVARQIRFTPAQKDGRAVSQYVVLEYNFNIY